MSPPACTPRPWRSGVSLPWPLIPPLPAKAAALASPDINTEDFQAAVDYLSLRDDVDPKKIGVIGICSWGGLALNAAALDTRIKATVDSTMYDMSG